MQAVQATVSDDTEVTYSLDGTGAEGASLGIAVIGERPYAEGMGDRENLSLDAEDIATVNNLKSAGIPVVVLVISGRPLIVNDIMPQTNALLARRPQIGQPRCARAGPGSRHHAKTRCRKAA